MLFHRLEALPKNRFWEVGGLTGPPLYADNEGSHIAYGGNRVILVCLLDTSTVCVAYVAYNSRTFKYVKNLLLR